MQRSVRDSERPQRKLIFIKIENPISPLSQVLWKGQYDLHLDSQRAAVGQRGSER